MVLRGTKGQEVGFRVATYYDIPLIPVKDMTATGAASSKLSDMLFLDTDHLWLSVMKPTQYFEGWYRKRKSIWCRELWAIRALYRTIGEVRLFILQRSRKEK